MELDQVHIELAPKAGNINQLRAEADAFRAGRIVKREADRNPRPRWVRPRVVFTVIVVVVIGLFMVGTATANVDGLGVSSTGPVSEDLDADRAMSAVDSSGRSNAEAILMKDSLLEGNNPSLVAPAQARKAFVEAHVATLMKKDHIEAGFPSNG